MKFQHNSWSGCIYLVARENSSKEKLATNLSFWFAVTVNICLMENSVNGITGKDALEVVPNHITHGIVIFHTSTHVIYKISNRIRFPSSQSIGLKELCIFITLRKPKSLCTLFPRHFFMEKKFIKFVSFLIIHLQASIICAINQIGNDLFMFPYFIKKFVKKIPPPPTSHERRY